MAGSIQVPGRPSEPLRRTSFSSFAQLLKKRLEATNRYRVFLTRSQDIFLPLEERVRFAQTHRADLFVSIHADSISGAHDVRGMTVYTRADRASDADSARLAERENRADAVAGVDTAEGPDEILDILQDLTLRETRAFSHGFATSLVNELDSVARLNKNARREARFWVLRAHDVPSVLLELGYLSSRRDLRPSGLRRVARQGDPGDFGGDRSIFRHKTCQAGSCRSFTIDKVWIPLADGRFLGGHLVQRRTMRLSQGRVRTRSRECIPLSGPMLYRSGSQCRVAIVVTDQPARISQGARLTGADNGT